MYVFRTTLVALVVIVSLVSGTRAQQNLAFSLFDRSLDQLRQESGIPGVSAAIVSGGRVVWERGFGMADVERSFAAAPDTPYPVGDLTQTLAATVVLQRVDRGLFNLADVVARWTNVIPEPQATVEQVLMHTSSGAFRYEPSRFAVLTPIIEYEYGRVPFRKVLATEILDPLEMRDSVPGHDMEQPSAFDQSFFSQENLNRYAGAVRRLAVPYRVDARRRATRSEYPPRSITAGTGLISSARDLARFDGALDASALLDADTMAAMWRLPATGSRVPTGLGWFVQTYNGTRIVWHFSLSANAFSSLVLKVPEQNLTLILLANSDGLSAPFALDRGDVTTSLYARLFLRVFLP